MKNFISILLLLVLAFASTANSAVFNVGVYLQNIPSYPNASIVMLNGAQYVNAAFATALAQATGPGGTNAVYFPSGDYSLDPALAELQVITPNTQILLSEGARVFLNDCTKGVIQIYGADGVLVQGGTFIGNCVRTKIGGSYLGQPARERNAAVFAVGSNSLIVNNITAINFNSGTFVSGYVGDNFTKTNNNLVENLFVYSSDFGVLANSQNLFTVTNINTHDITEAQQIDPHSVYMSGDVTTGFHPNSNITIDGVHDTNNQYDSSVKVKFTQGITIKNVVSNSVRAGMDLSDSPNMEVSNFTINDLFSNNLGNNSSGINSYGNHGISIHDGTISIRNGETKSHGIVIRDGANQGVDALVNNVTVNTSLPVKFSGTAYAFFTIETALHTTFENCIVVDLNSVNSPGFGLGGGSNHVVTNPKDSASTVVKIAPPSGGNTINFSLAVSPNVGVIDSGSPTSTININP